MVRGEVKWFNNKKGYGFIAAETGEDVFVHHSAIQDEAEYKELAEGQQVKFDIEDSPKGKQAVNVVKLEASDTEDEVYSEQEESEK